MAAYLTGNAVALYPGNTQIVSNASLPLLKTQAVAVASLTNGDVYLSVNNLSGVVMTVQYSHDDVDAHYQAYYDGATAITVAATKAAAFRGAGGFYRLLAASDPGVNIVAISR